MRFLIMKSPVQIIKRVYYLWKFHGMYLNAINLKKGDIIDSCQLLEESISLIHKYDLPFEKEKLEIYYNAYSFHLQSNNRAKALQYIELCLQIEASNVKYFLARGIIHYLDKNYIKAESDFLHSLFLQNDNSLALYHLSRTSLKLEKYGKALNIINRSIELNPNYPMAMLIRSFCLFHDHKFNKAEELYKDLITINSLKWIKLMKNLKGEEQFNKEFWIENLVQETNQKRFLEIINKIENIFVIQPLLLKGFHYTAKQEYDRALIELNSVISLDPNIRSIYTLMGYIKHLQNDFESSETFLKKAFEMGDTDAKSALIEKKIEELYKKINYTQTLF
ncbi:lipopolysaccharide assembly protein LapB [Flammeovirga sp. SJP92]|uniref:tetratricopeptide repeat protein n=1 Tax=Flammeovirga sp. SJP92 TaxID=1775430 RepID=UPI000788136D|nr:hypothetical protein [Flammeovirga sp. SJP92]KXX67170.1 hypothetical protein AVL50_27670 [Flammeovirga sp. SJP92]